MLNQIHKLISKFRSVNTKLWFYLNDSSTMPYGIKPKWLAYTIVGIGLLFFALMVPSLVKVLLVIVAVYWLVKLAKHLSQLTRFYIKDRRNQKLETRLQSHHIGPASFRKKTTRTYQGPPNT